MTTLAFRHRPSSPTINPHNKKEEPIMIPKVLITGSNYFSDAIRDALTTDHPEYIVNSLPRDDHCSKITLKENAAEYDIVIRISSRPPPPPSPPPSP
jgi:hypothetical protein